MARQRLPVGKLNVGAVQVRSLVSSFFRSGLAVLLPLAMTGAAYAQDIRIGLVAPLSGQFQLLGEQFANGARVAAQDAGVELVDIDDGCTSEGGGQAATALAESGVLIAIGFLCTPSLEAALPVLTETAISVLTPARAERLTDQRRRTGWPVWRIGPRGDDEARAVANLLIDKWRNNHFAIIDDGTIYGRELAENLRAEAELAGLEPVLVDTFRPQLENQIGLVGRLRRSGATHVFVGGDRFDIAVIARDARQLDYDVVLAGGEALRAAEDAVRLPAGVLMIAAPRWEDLASPEQLQRFRDAGIVPEGYVMQGHAAMDIAAGAVRAAIEENTPVGEQLGNFAFDTSIGVIRFDEKGDLTANPFRLFIYDGTDFIEGED